MASHVFLYIFIVGVVILLAVGIFTYFYVRDNYTKIMTKMESIMKNMMKGQTGST